MTDSRFPELRVRHASFYHKDTGIFSGYHVHTDEPGIALNTPPDHVAIEGAHDHLSKRVDLTTGEVIDYQPSAPSPDHEWNADTKRWQLSAAALGKIAAKSAALARIAALEASQHAVLRKALLGDPAALAQLAAIDGEIVALQGTL
jgi:hypothetical protein